MFRLATKRAYTASARVFAAEAAVSSTDGLTVNFATPYASVISKTVVEMITLPGEGGVYAVTKDHAATVSQLAPGVVSIAHIGGNVDNYFVPGGFALTHANNVTDISVPEAFALADLDENIVKSSLASAMKTLAGEAEGSEAKQVAQIEVDTLSALARALGVGGV